MRTDKAPPSRAPKVIVGIGLALGVGVILYFAVLRGGPSESQVRTDLERGLGNYLMHACGYAGTMGMEVHGISNIDVDSDGSGTATVAASNSGLFTAPESCEMRVGFQYVERDGRWILQDVEQF